ncbi:hypothetical protein SteCoe_25338 [Stentor coeruleus]|uniref:glycerol-3-phosphate dehydrogenase n=1 Tax=Stentor coeruleus TaxID=5963 RepID=A0A1R2BFH4_9CILI|nr:hypothetical protein SteCoe_25338 [Stentor coeruleus]
MKKLLFSGALLYGAHYYISNIPPKLNYIGTKTRQREENLESMKKETYDIFIIGGGATGAGVALEASTRGLKSCLIDKGDFAGQTSSKSTKLLHGGVRYLDKAVHGEEISANINLVLEGLRERSTILKSAPYMTSWVGLAVPCTSYFDLIYFYCGLLAYHMMAFTQSFYGPYIPWPYLSLNKMIIPYLKNDFKGSVVYYDGQMNDCRLCIEVLLTSATDEYISNSVPCHIANYVEFVDFTWEKGKISGAKVKDLETGNIFEIKSKVVVNCTGPFSDRIRLLGGLKEKRIVPGKGSHVILPSNYAPKSTGMLIPKTKDGRVLFLVPWEGHTILGTTDELGEVTETSKISDMERKFLVEELSKYISIAPYKINQDILGSFSGERPLVKGLGGNTSSLLRTHEVEIAESGLVSVLGGKWTTFRAMGEEAIDKVVENFEFHNAKKSVTKNLVFLRNKEDPDQKINLPKYISEKTFDYLTNHYGNHANIVAALGEKKLINNMPFIEGEVRYAIKHEYALHPIDVVARRIRLALIDYKSCKFVLKKVTRIMAEELNWTEAKKEAEYEKSLKHLKVFISDSN